MFMFYSSVTSVYTAMVVYNHWTGLLDWTGGLAVFCVISHTASRPRLPICNIYKMQEPPNLLPIAFYTVLVPYWHNDSFDKDS